MEGMVSADHAANKLTDSHEIARRVQCRQEGRVCLTILLSLPVEYMHNAPEQF